MLLLEVASSAIVIPATLGAVVHPALSAGIDLPSLIQLITKVTPSQAKFDEGIERLLYEAWRLNPTVKLLMRRSNQDEAYGRDTVEKATGSPLSSARRASIPLPSRSPGGSPSTPFFRARSAISTTTCCSATPGRPAVLLGQGQACALSPHGVPQGGGAVERPEESRRPARRAQEVRAGERRVPDAVRQRPAGLAEEALSCSSATRPYCRQRLACSARSAAICRIGVDRRK